MSGGNEITCKTLQAIVDAANVSAGCSCAFVPIGHGLRQRNSDPECIVHSPDDPLDVERDREV